MGKVVEIGIGYNKGGKIQNVNKVEAVKGQGLLNDRKFAKDNQKESQITLIEIENIYYFNNKYKTNITPIDFRRNIITKDIRLNELIGKELIVGNVKLKAHDLCRPCKYLEELLGQKSLVKELLFKGGLRCEILTSGKIYVNDIINI